MDTLNGKIRVRAWPRRRGKPKSTAQAETQSTFAEYQRAWRYIAPQFAKQLTEAVSGTPLYPRDILTSMLANRFCQFQMPDGRILYPVTTRNQVSEALDAISQTEGFILVRGEQFWEARPYVPGLEDGALVQITSPFSWTTAGTYAVPFDEAVYDSALLWDASQPTRLTIPAGVSSIQLFAMMQTATGGGQFLGQVRKNGSLYPNVVPGLPQADTDTAGTDSVNLAGAPIPVEEGDYFELMLYMAGGGSVGTAWFSAKVNG